MTTREVVEQSLQSSILKRLEGSHAILRHPKRRAFVIYQYGHEALLILAGIGFSHPFLSAVGGTAKSSPDRAQTFLATLLLYPLWLAIPCLLMISSWLVLRLFISVEKLDEKVPLYNACRLELERIESNLDEALSSPCPWKELKPIQRDATKVINRYHEKGGWPWPVGPNDERSRARVIKRAKELCDSFEKGWKPLPIVEREEQKK